ncbi:MAG: pantetheine-phosphate adenylyltransferase [Elusimicrobia bacterium]|nr:pantetheine-phosphate adenylyltransferase [Elusimicrobiota bacterium]
MKRTAVYPGSFDPVTRGHLDIIERAGRLFDRVIVAVLTNPSKRCTFSVSERLRMLEACVRGVPGVEVDAMNGLLVDYLKTRDSRILIRGLRAVSDLDYEFQLASINRQLDARVETVFLMPDERYTYVSSSIVKTVAQFGAQVDDLLPPAVCRMLRRKYPLSRSRSGKRRPRRALSFLSRRGRRARRKG